MNQTFSGVLPGEVRDASELAANKESEELAQNEEEPKSATKIQVRGKVSSVRREVQEASELGEKKQNGELAQTEKERKSATKIQAIQRGSVVRREVQALGRVFAYSSSSRAKQANAAKKLADEQKGKLEADAAAKILVLEIQKLREENDRLRADSLEAKLVAKKEPIEVSSAKELEGTWFCNAAKSEYELTFINEYTIAFKEKKSRGAEGVLQRDVVDRRYWKGNLNDGGVIRLHLNEDSGIHSEFMKSRQDEWGPETIAFKAEHLHGDFCDVATRMTIWYVEEKGETIVGGFGSNKKGTFAIEGKVSSNKTLTLTAMKLHGQLRFQLTWDSYREMYICEILPSKDRSSTDKPRAIAENTTTSYEGKKFYLAQGSPSSTKKNAYDDTDSDTDVDMETDEDQKKLNKLARRKAREDEKFKKALAQINSELESEKRKLAEEEERRKARAEFEFQQELDKVESEAKENERLLDLEVENLKMKHKYEVAHLSKDEKDHAEDEVKRKINTLEAKKEAAKVKLQADIEAMKKKHEEEALDAENRAKLAMFKIEALEAEREKLIENKEIADAAHKEEKEKLEKLLAEQKEMREVLEKALEEEVTLEFAPGDNGMMTGDQLVAHVIPDTQAQQYGVEPGWKVAAVGGEPCVTFADKLYKNAAAGNQNYKLTLIKPKAIEPVTISLLPGEIGIESDTQGKVVSVKEKGQAARRGVRRGWHISKVEDASYCRSCEHELQAEHKLLEDAKKGKDVYSLRLFKVKRDLEEERRKLEIEKENSIIQAVLGGVAGFFLEILMACLFSSVLPRAYGIISWASLGFFLIFRCICFAIVLSHRKKNEVPQTQTTKENVKRNHNVLMMAVRVIATAGPSALILGMSTWGVVKDCAIELETKEIRSYTISQVATYQEAAIVCYNEANPPLFELPHQGYLAYFLTAFFPSAIQIITPVVFAYIITNGIGNFIMLELCQDSHKAEFTKRVIVPLLQLTVLDFADISGFAATSWEVSAHAYLSTLNLWFWVTLCIIFIGYLATWAEVVYLMQEAQKLLVPSWMKERIEPWKMRNLGNNPDATIKKHLHRNKQNSSETNTRTSKEIRLGELCDLWQTLEKRREEERKASEQNVKVRNTTRKSKTSQEQTSVDEGGQNPTALNATGEGAKEHEEEMKRTKEKLTRIRYVEMVDELIKEEMLADLETELHKGFAAISLVVDIPLGLLRCYMWYCRVEITKLYLAKNGFCALYEIAVLGNMPSLKRKLQSVLSAFPGGGVMNEKMDKATSANEKASDKTIEGKKDDSLFERFLDCVRHYGKRIGIRAEVITEKKNPGGSRRHRKQIRKTWEDMMASMDYFVTKMQYVFGLLD